MSRKPPSPPRRGALSKEDEALWEHTAASLKPLRTRKSRHLAAAYDPDEAPAPEPPRKGATARKSAAAEPARPPAKAPPVKPPSVTVNLVPAPKLNNFDHKAARRLRQGQISIEARIDLHGMRQQEAHTALRRFLLSAAARGVRWALVITGKGGPRRTRDDAEDSWDFTPERGVLRRNVPMWLAEPELRAVVVSFTTAAISHGGEGALYVQLRNTARSRS